MQSSKKEHSVKASVKKHGSRPPAGETESNSGFGSRPSTSFEAIGTKYGDRPPSTETACGRTHGSRPHTGQTGGDSGFGSRPSTSSEAGEDVILVPLYRKYIQTGKPFFVTSKKVLSRLQTTEQRDTIFLFCNAGGNTKSNLNNTLKDAAFAAICSRLPSVKVSRVVSTNSIFANITNKAERERMEKTLEDVLAGYLCETMFEGMIAKYAHEGIASLEEKAKVRRTTVTQLAVKNMTKEQMDALLGLCQREGAATAEKSTEEINEQMKTKQSKKSMKTIVQDRSVFEAVSKRPNALLVDFPPVFLSVMYIHESLFDDLISDVTSEDTIKELFLSPCLLQEMKDRLLHKILQMAQQIYPLDPPLCIAKYCSSGEKILFGYDDTVTELKKNTYCGIRIEIRNPKVIYAEETGERRKIKRKSTAPNILENINDFINFHSYNLWKSHSNLNAIFAEIYGKREYDFTLILVCSAKGISPLNEPPFPKELEGIPVKVYEGYFSFGPRFGNPHGYNDPLCMGCTIGAEGNDCIGSLGLFIEEEGSTKFLTCAHVLYDFDSNGELDFFNTVNVLQPSQNDIHCEKAIEEKIIGTIDRDKAVFTPCLITTKTRDISVDAALVTLAKRIPNEGIFAVRDKQQLTKSGFTEGNPPRLSSRHDKDILHTEHGKRVFKSGGSSGFTMGFINIYGAQVKIEGSHRRFTTSRSGTANIMKGQYEIRDIGDVFFIPGDSGSAVFSQDESGGLCCVGIAIGFTEMGPHGRSTLMTPIKAVLKELDLTPKNVKSFK